MFKAYAEQVLADIHAKKEAESKAHQIYREKSVSPEQKIPGFVDIQKTGVIYVTSRASEFGFSYENHEWANLGQGAPETTQLEGQPERKLTAEFNPFNNEYAPVAGEIELRKKIAKLYNERYRQGKASQYTHENVCVCPGGRAALARLAACIGDVNVGYFLPDYTAYEQLLSVFKSFVPIPNSLDSSSGYKLDKATLKKEIEGRGLQVILTSNPGNPTGALLEDQELQDIIDVSKQTHCSFILDEFYSHYIYSHGVEDLGRSVSGASFVDDVNKDPIIIVDGLTKNWRLPGWRMAWVLAPKTVVSTLQSAGSFLDGGANHVLQDTVVKSNILDYDFVKADTAILQKVFREKRDFVISRLTALGIKIDSVPSGTFYIWANVIDLPPPLNNGMSFFECALLFKVIVVPGIFFDVNPGKRRELFNSPFHHYIRISYGPSMDALKIGMDGIEALIKKHSHVHEHVRQ